VALATLATPEFRRSIYDTLVAGNRLSDRAVQAAFNRLALLHNELSTALSAELWRGGDIAAIRAQVDGIVRRAAEDIVAGGMEAFEASWVSGETFGQRIIRFGQPVPAGTTPAGAAWYAPEGFAGTPGFTAARMLRAHDAFQAFTFDRITAITEAMRAQIAQVVAVGFLGELTPFEVMQQITHIVGIRNERLFRELGSTGLSYKAELILRTETIAAQNAATQIGLQGAAQRFPDLLKVWLATGDDRTRDTHLATHGQVRPVDKAFNVGGEGGPPADYPGDPQLPIGERANCRCRSVPYREAWGPLEDLLGADLEASIEGEKMRRGQGGVTLTPQQRLLADVMAEHQSDIDDVVARMDRATRRAGKAVRAAQAEADVAMRTLRDHIAEFGLDQRDVLEALRVAFRDKQKLLIKAQVVARSAGQRALRLPPAERPGWRRVLWDPGTTAFQRGRAREAQDFLRTITSKDVFGDAIVPIRASYQQALETANYDPAIRRANLFVADGLDTYIHEFGHHLENIGGTGHHLQARAIEYELSRRMPGEDMHVVGGAPWQTGYRDKWYTPYTGRLYPNNAPSWGPTNMRQTEIVSTGVENLYNNPMEFAQRDPGHFAFIVGLLRGWW